MKYDPDKHHRRSIRLKGYNYALPGRYFITICTRHRECFLGTIVENEMKLSPLGVTVRTCWHDLPRHYANVMLDEFVIMPNHIHGIIELTDVIVGAGLRPAPTKTPSPEIVRAFKSFSSRQINELRDTMGAPVWQRSYYEHIIRNENNLNTIRQYIIRNPLHWLLDKDNPVRQR